MATKGTFTIDTQAKYCILNCRALSQESSLRTNEVLDSSIAELHIRRGKMELLESKSFDGPPGECVA